MSEGHIFAMFRRIVHPPPESIIYSSSCLFKRRYFEEVCNPADIHCIDTKLLRHFLKILFCVWGFELHEDEQVITELIIWCELLL